MSKLSREDVLKLAKLSRLKLTDEEVEKLIQYPETMRYRK